MSRRVPIPATDKAAEALSLSHWLVTDGPSATAADLKEAGRRLEECIDQIRTDRIWIESLRDALHEAQQTVEDALTDVDRVLRS